MTIRPCTENDYDAASALFRAMMGETFQLDHELWTMVCRRESHMALCAEDDETKEVIGIASVVVTDRIRLDAGTRRRRYHLDQLIVSPNYRRNGIGRTLVQHVAEIARENAPSYIIVNCDFTNVAARKTYESAGLHLVRQSADRFEIAFP